MVDAAAICLISPALYAAFIRWVHPAGPLPGAGDRRYQEEGRTVNKTRLQMLQIRNLSKTYVSGSFAGLGGRRHQVLENISLDLYAGETLGLIGRSGSGKSTLGRCIVRRESIDSGSISCAAGHVAGQKTGWFAVEGHSEAGAAAPVLPDSLLHEHIQLVHQATGNALNPYESGEQQLQSILRRRGRSSRAAAGEAGEYLQICGLDGHSGQRLPRQLSGGQRQRLLIARALAMEPEILILDEPVASLDVSVQARILNMLARIQDDLGLAYLFITHDIDIACYISDELAVLHEGRIIEAQPVESIIASPQQPYTRMLLSAGLKKGDWVR
jgi:peptide/nickel transport system ATP-binding protein